MYFKNSKARTRQKLQANRKARRMYPLDFVKRSTKGYYCFNGKYLQFCKRDVY